MATTRRREHETRTQPWGTLEELLLACAVDRHGTKSWDLIAMEMQNRTSTLPSLTPQNCLDKFNDLKRRFLSQNDADSSSSLVDELKKIRVAELRDEVKRRDVSIVSLEMKVKKLEEERERSFKEEADLEREKMLSQGIVAGKSVVVVAAGDDDDRSFNESNSTSEKGELVKKKNNPRNDVVEEEEEEEGDEEARIKTDPVGKSKPDPVQTGSDPDRIRDWSRNGKLDKDDDDDDNNNNNNSTVKKGRENGVKTSEAGGLGESNELRESVSESKRGEAKEVGKQNSDVQSSASLSKKKRRRRGVGIGGAGGISSGEEPEGDEVSPATKRVSAVKSDPLVQFLGIIRSHRLGWAFERRQRSQESERYNNLIRQHMDLQTIQSRLNKGVYDCIQKFFRDLLLLFNNAIIFYKNNSQEHLAAQELRSTVTKEMTNYKLRKPPQPMTVKSETEQQLVSFSKTNKSPTMVACGKRSSIKAISENASKKGEKKERDVDEKTKVNEKKIEGSFVSVEEKGTRKKRSKERSVSGRRNSRTSNKSSGEIKHEYGGNVLSSHDAVEVKVDKRETRVKKRQGAASFLKRMKQNSPSEVVDNDDDVSEDESGDDKGEKQKKGRGRKREGRTDRVTRSSRGRGAREESGKVRRGVGRPPKRQAAMESTGKRGRDNGENEVGLVGGGRPRKRSRR